MLFFINNLNTIYYFQRHLEKTASLQTRKKSPRTHKSQLKAMKEDLTIKTKKKEITIYFNLFSIKYMMN